MEKSFRLGSTPVTIEELKQKLDSYGGIEKISQSVSSQDKILNDHFGGKKSLRDTLLANLETYELLISSMA